jgi:hypothetical protein
MHKLHQELVGNHKKFKYYIGITTKSGLEEEKLNTGCL